MKRRGLSIRVLTLEQFPDIPPVVEGHSTLKENAIKKAVEVSKHTILPVLADDSGLEVKALKGKPGVRSARFARSTRPDPHRPQDTLNIAKLLRAMRAIPPKQRKARFVCWLAFAAGGRLIRFFEGRCEGQIASSPQGSTGFGYDPVFIPRGDAKTLAQLGSRRKDALSHRARAIKKFHGWLRRSV